MVNHLPASAVLDGLAIAGFRAFAAQTGHLRADYLTAEAAEIFERRDEGTMAGHGDGRERFKINVFISEPYLNQGNRNRLIINQYYGLRRKVRDHLQNRLPIQS